MPKKTRWHSLSSVSKVIVGTIGLVASIVTILQLIGTIDFWNPLYDFFTSSVSVYYVALGIAVILILAYLLLRFRRENILDWEYGRWIAELCQTPRTTEYLRRNFEEWDKGNLGGPNLDYYIKRLQKQGYLKYGNGKWEVSDEALDYIEKYHGD